MSRFPNLNTFRTVLFVLIALNVLAGLYLVIDLGFEKRLECSGSGADFDCGDKTHVNIGPIVSVVISAAISIFLLSMLIVLLGAVEHFEGALARLNARVAEMEATLTAQGKALAAAGIKTASTAPASDAMPAQAFVRQGRAAAERGDHAAAVDLLSQAIKADPAGVPMAYYYRAQSYRALGQEEQAAQDMARYNELA